MRKPKRLIYDRNVNFAQAKIIEDKKAEQKRLQRCANLITKVLDDHNAMMVPVFVFEGSIMRSNIIYKTKPPPPPAKDIN